MPPSAISPKNKGIDQSAITTETLSESSFIEENDSLIAPPGILARGPLYLVFAIVIVGLVYASITQVDIIVTAPIKIRGEEVQTNSPISGVIRSVRVQNGDVIEPGIILLRIEPQEGFHQLSREKELRFSLQEIKFQKELLEKQKKTTEDFLKANQQTLDRLIVLHTKMQRDAKKQTQHLLRQIEVDRENLRINEKLYSKSLIVKSELDRSHAQFEQTLDNQDDFQRQQQNMQLTMQDRIEGIKQEIFKATTSITEQENRIKMEEERLNQTFASSAWGANIQMKKGLIEISSLYPARVIQIDCKSQQLVREGQPLIHLMRTDVPLTAIAFVGNRDVGLLRKNLAVKIKLDAFPYQEYGTLDGLIQRINLTVADIEGLGSAYPTDVVLRQLYLKMGNHRINVIPGLSGIAEIAAKKDVRLIPPLKKLLEENG